MIWIFGIVTALFLVFLYNAINKILNFFHRQKKVTLDTPVEVFMESDGMDNTVAQRSMKVKRSYAALYEKMCILDPIKYEKDPMLTEVINMYQKIVSGKIPDVYGEHIPSEYMERKPNLDYKRYLVNQRTLLKAMVKVNSLINIDWLEKLYQEFRILEKYRNAKEVFIQELTEAGLPYITVLHLATDERMAITTPEQWKAIKDQLERYLNDFENHHVSEYIDQAKSIEVLCDYDKMETFSTWLKEGVPSDLAFLNVSGAIDEDAMHKVIRLNKSGLEIQEAIRRVLAEVLEKATEDNLREKYRNQTK